MSDILILAGLFLLCFIQRFMIAWKNPTAFDSYGHLYFAVCVNEQKVGPFGSIHPAVVGGDTFNHPFLFHWFVGLLGREWLLASQKIINPVLDSIFLVFAAFVLLRNGVVQSDVINCGLLYVFTPLWFSKISVGPRIGGFTPRLLSEVCISLLILIWFYPAFDSGAANILLQIFLVVITLLSSKFGVQVVVILVFGGLLLIGPVSSIPILVLSFLVSAIVSKGQLLENLRSQFDHLKWYFRATNRGQIFAANRNQFSRLFVWELKGSFRQNIGRLILNWLARNSYTSTVIKAPILLIFLYIALTEHRSSLVDAQTHWPAWAIVIFVLINRPLFLFLGEAERYINHCAYLLVLCVALRFPEVEGTTYLKVLVIYGALFWLAEIYFINFKGLHRLEDETASDRCISILKAEDEDKVVASFPYHFVAPYRVMLETNHEVFFPIISGQQAQKNQDRYESVYPYLDLERLNELYSDCGVNTVVISLKELRLRYPDWRIPSGWGVQLFEVEDMVILQRPSE
ncbi:hypothetical protein [Kordiimonas sp.]|uniref:hypothetical protein n=1 Tax=Kordiimonas sp. TaxID=1970157 RepID=UPI003B52D463